MNVDFWRGVITGMGIVLLMFGGIEFLRTISAKRIAKIKTPAELPPTDRTDTLDLKNWHPVLNEQESAVKIPGTNEFSVSGKPRTVPWHIRRKELEAKSRTKRERLESFQEHI